MADDTRLTPAREKYQLVHGAGQSATSALFKCLLQRHLMPCQRLAAAANSLSEASRRFSPAGARGSENQNLRPLKRMCLHGVTVTKRSRLGFGAPSGAACKPTYVSVMGAQDDETPGSFMGGVQFQKASMLKFRPCMGQHYSLLCTPCPFQIRCATFVQCRHGIEPSAPGQSEANRPT